MNIFHQRRYTMQSKRMMIKIDEEKCTGCGLCVPGCEEGALQIVDGKAKLVAEIYCDGLGACLGECPEGALTVEERVADDFDPEAVKQLLAEQGRPIPEHMPDPESLRLEKGKPSAPPAGGCPGAALKTLTPCQQANIPKSSVAEGTNLSHWPVQLRLVPPSAPFLANADLLLTADCVPVALPNYHAEYLAGKVVVMGCPKFDNAMEYVSKLADIIRENNLKSITIMEMEVPCCSSMSAILDQAMKQAGQSVKVERIVVSLRGQILSREQIAG